MEIVRTVDDGLISLEELYRQFIVTNYYEEFVLWKKAIVIDEINIS